MQTSSLPRRFTFQPDSLGRRSSLGRSATVKTPRSAPKGGSLGAVSTRLSDKAGGFLRLIRFFRKRILLQPPADSRLRPCLHLSFSGLPDSPCAQPPLRNKRKKRNMGQIASHRSAFRPSVSSNSARTFPDSRIAASAQPIYAASLCRPSRLEMSVLLNPAEVCFKACRIVSARGSPKLWPKMYAADCSQ